MHSKCIMLKKCFWSYTEVSVLKKIFLNHINKIPYHRGSKLIPHAMSLHPLCIPSMFIVSKLMINNVAEKQQKTNVGDKNVISLSSKYTVNM